jgi:hypothetical protein
LAPPSESSASLAQSVERFTRNEKVASSILAGGSSSRGFEFVSNPLDTLTASFAAELLGSGEDEFLPAEGRLQISGVG